MAHHQVSLYPGFRYMYPFHPVTVHLPIGLLVGNAILTVLYLRRGERSLETAAYHCLWLGLLLTIPALLTGTIDAGRQLVGTATPRTDALGWINAHAAVGVAVVVVYWQAWQLRRRNPTILDDDALRRAYLVRLGVGVLLIAIDGWLGGHLVYSLKLGIDM
ncbi:MAG: DUF2231 domain-containing protein [Chloroflexi bacterium AL-W]|nr:DUF2231 domain-containing protein [Chloroflexi bacterium AL-N1]NOK69059.1 DUF2231 domain-containing protein [Chloroflexi bacterium AL-N10]NOK77042.1 DUF2231 domain-containing protein [Chloroflexi bacterium AL-N5]NOK83687.1 DUF2231 domain-containing protein [Chloroflexi bacterium AL-W]NOK90897.1 DUF2231 domain-containing protein [Chloroflexi bacterium AL-N15]